jgi:hypothetical protein
VEDYSYELYPVAIVDSLRDLPAESFRALYTGVMLLLVRLDRGQPDLERGLSDATVVDSEPAPQSGVATTEMLRIDLARDPADLADPAHVALFGSLHGAPHFVVPLCMRRPAPTQRRHAPRGEGRDEGALLSVGRSLKSDVILLDPTVSGTHAWLACSAGQAWTVRDAGSRNGTFTNDLRLASGESAWIQPMDRLKFGAVSACLCPPAVLRRVLRLTHPVS